MKPDFGKVEKGNVEIFTSGGMPQPTPNVTPKKRKQYAVVSVAIVLVVAMVIGGFLGAMHMMHKNTLKTFETTIRTGEGRYEKETINIDEEKQTATYEANDDTTGFKLIMDYKRGLSISRVWMDGRKMPLCFIAHLNKAGLPSPKELAKYLETNPTPGSEGDPVRESFNADRDPIADISFLGDGAEALCKGLKVYWAVPSGPMAEKGSTPGRKKREYDDHHSAEHDYFHPNVSLQCPLPKYGFLKCEQIDEACMYDCCEHYRCFVYAIRYNPDRVNERCFNWGCTKPVIEQKCHCVHRYQYIRGSGYDDDSDSKDDDSDSKDDDSDSKDDDSDSKDDDSDSKDDDSDSKDDSDKRGDSDRQKTSSPRTTTTDDDSDRKDDSESDDDSYTTGDSDRLKTSTPRTTTKQ